MYVNTSRYRYKAGEKMPTIKQMNRQVVEKKQIVEIWQSMYEKNTKFQSRLNDKAGDG